MMISLAGKAALVTGGSRGIGAATVKVFAEAGADVVFNFHRQREAAAKLELEARKYGTRIESFQADLGRMVNAKKLVSWAIKRLGRLDILVVNVGIWNAKDVPIESLGEHEWDEMLQGESEGRLWRDPLCSGPNDCAERRQDYRHQLHRGPAR